MALDKRIHSTGIRIQENFYEFYAGLQYTATHLFRYKASAGPLFLIEESYLDLRLTEATKRTYRRWQLASAADFGIDYAFNEEFEIGLGFSLQWRSAVHKLDRAYSWTLFWNI
jgi:hypothetical protein